MLVDNLKKLQSQHPLQDSIVFSPHLDLLGKRVRHKWVDEDGKEEWHYGHILSLVLGTVEWFNVQYDDEEQVICTLILTMEIWTQ